MNEIIVQSRKRSAFLIAKEKFAMKNGVSVEQMNDALIMPIIVRAQTKLVNGKSSYTIDLVKGTSTLLGCETKLEKTDQLVIQSIGLGIQKYDPAAAEDFAEPIMTYADPVYFGAAVSKQLEKIWNGKTSLKVGNTSPIDGLQNLLMRYVPNGGYAGASVAAPTDHAEYGPDNDRKGFTDLGLTLLVSGENTLQAVVDLAPGAIATIADSGATSNNLVFLVEGFVYRGSNGNPGQCQSF